MQKNFNKAHLRNPHLFRFSIVAIFLSSNALSLSGSPLEQTPSGVSVFKSLAPSSNDLFASFESFLRRGDASDKTEDIDTSSSWTPPSPLNLQPWSSDRTSHPFNFSSCFSKERSLKTEDMETSSSQPSKDWVRAGLEKQEASMNSR